MVSVDNQTPPDRSLRGGVRVMSLRRQYVICCNTDLAMTAHAPVNSGMASCGSWPVILIKSFAGRLLQIVRVFVSSHFTSLDRLIYGPNEICFRRANSVRSERSCRHPTRRLLKLLLHGACRVVAAARPPVHRSGDFSPMIGIASCVFRPSSAAFMRHLTFDCSDVEAPGPSSARKKTAGKRLPRPCHRS